MSVAFPVESRTRIAAVMLGVWFALFEAHAHAAPEEIGKRTADAFKGRKGATRAKRLLAEGGNAASEAAVSRGLKWLALHQAADGHWGLHDFNRFARTAPLPKGRIKPDKSIPGTIRRNDTAGTALGLLPFLARGISGKADEKPKSEYSKTVDAGLRWLLRKQSKARSDRGFCGGDCYGHALATIALCEAYGLTSDAALKASAQEALKYIVLAQDPSAGGWRYLPRKGGDLSVTGWMLTALKTGQMVGLSVPRATLRKAEKFLDSVESTRKGGYCYMPGGGERPAMTAVGLLCRQYMGVNPRNAGLLAGIKRLKGFTPDKTSDLYYESYATRVMFNMGGADWKAWNLGAKGGKGGMRDLLLRRQEKAGDNAGSWTPRPGRRRDYESEKSGGRLMSTSLSLLTLQIYYRYPPLYRRE
jgi:hypothetical protein